MKESFRKIKKRVDKELSVRRYERDVENRMIINMTVKDDSDFLSVFSENETPVISTNVADFIENSTHALPPKEEFTLRIYSNCIDDEEKTDYQKAIKEYYAEKYIANEKELKRNIFLVFVLMLVGIFVLAFAFQVDHAIWAEVIDIAAWVFLWEAVDISAFLNRSLRLKRKRYIAYMSMKFNNIDY